MLVFLINNICFFLLFFIKNLNFNNVLSSFHKIDDFISSLKSLYDILGSNTYLNKKIFYDIYIFKYNIAKTG